jgi:hypothetical protein
MTGVADSDSIRTKFSAVFTNWIVPAQFTGVAAGGRGFFLGRNLPRPPSQDVGGASGLLPDG